MPPAPQADRPQYAGGNPVPDFIDSTTQQYSRGMDPVTGAKYAEPTEPVPVLVSVAPATAGLAGGVVHTVTGTNLGGSTAATVGGTATTAFEVLSETQLRFTSPAKAAGAHAVAVANPAGAATGSVSITFS